MAADATTAAAPEDGVSPRLVGLVSSPSLSFFLSLPLSVLSQHLFFSLY